MQELVLCKQQQIQNLFLWDTTKYLILYYSFSTTSKFFETGTGSSDYTPQKRRGGSRSQVASLSSTIRQPPGQVLPAGFWQARSPAELGVSVLSAGHPSHSPTQSNSTRHFKSYQETGEKTLAITELSLEIIVPMVTLLLLASLKEKACKKSRSASILL